MDTQIKYQQSIKEILLAYSEYRSKGSDIASEILFDDQRGRYLVLNIGWSGKDYWHITPIHIDLIGDKIWIQYDDTEEGVASDLLAAGVPKENIVLGFHHPKVRPYTEFTAG